MQLNIVAVAVCLSLVALSLGALVSRAHAAGENTGADLSAVMPINVKEVGAIGDGTTDDTAAIQRALDMAFGTVSAPHGNTGGQIQNRPIYFPQGHYVVTAPLKLNKVMGGMISGAGRFSTEIENTRGGSVFVSNGFEYSRVEGMELSASASGADFDLDWDGTANAGCQSDTFADMEFGGGAYGVRIGHSGFQCSENIFQNDFWINHSVAGLFTDNFNALQNTVVGGNFQSEAIGILVGSGSVPSIISVGFQENGWDVQVNNSAYDTYAIIGCRTESANFVNMLQPAPITLIADTQTAVKPGIFVQSRGPGNIDGNISTTGRIMGNGTNRINIRGSFFSQSAWLASKGVVDPNNAILSIANGTPVTLTGEQVAGGDEVIIDLSARLTMPGRVLLPNAKAIQQLGWNPGRFVYPTQSTRLRIMNNSPTDFPWTLIGNSGVNLVGNVTIPHGMWRDFFVQFGDTTDSPSVTISSIGAGTL